MTTTADIRRPLVVINGPGAEAELLRQSITAQFEAHGELSILEAGCGNHWAIQLPGVRYSLTGLDVNQDALNIRKNQRKDLNDAILGDLRTATLDENRYDVVYNSFVLEHVDGAQAVLDNFIRWLRPGGVLILRIPDPRSVYGFLSSLTPFWFHVFYKRWVAGVKTAGKPGYDPFPTVYDDVVSREGIRQWCRDRGLTIRSEVAWNYAVGKAGLMSHLVQAAMSVFSALTLGRLESDHVNLTYIIEKPEVDASIDSTSSTDVSSREPAYATVKP